MNNLTFIVILAILIVIAWLVSKHGFWVVIFGLGIISGLFMIVSLTVHFILKPPEEQSKKCIEICQSIYSQCGQECYAQSSGYQVKICFDDCSQVLTKCFSICEKEKKKK